MTSSEAHPRKKRRCRAACMARTLAEARTGKKWPLRICPIGVYCRIPPRGIEDGGHDGWQLERKIGGAPAPHRRADRGCRRMVEDDRYCVDVLLQIASAQAALGQAGALVLRSHVDTCVNEAMTHGTPAQRKKKIDELMGV